MRVSLKVSAVMMQTGPLASFPKVQFDLKRQRSRLDNPMPHPLARRSSDRTAWTMEAGQDGWGQW